MLRPLRCHRAIQEQAVFRQLLKHCPDLEERVLKSSADELEHLANLVSTHCWISTFVVMRNITFRYKRALTERVPTTQKG